MDRQNEKTRTLWQQDPGRGRHLVEASGNTTIAQSTQGCEMLQWQRPVLDHLPCLGQSRAMTRLRSICLHRLHGLTEAQVHACAALAWGGRHMTDARTFTVTLGGRWFDGYGTAPCPVCQPERRADQTALTLSDGRSGLLVHCKKSDCRFADILAAAGVTHGTWHPPAPETLARRRAEEQATRDKRAQQAAALWKEARPIAWTLAERYLRGRRISCALGDALRFHPACWHGATAARHPALVARVDGGESFAVHRTYLRPDGSGKAALDPAKAMLGSVSGGAVRLMEGHQDLAVAEGIETALSLACGLLHTPATIWAALSTSGLRKLVLPPDPGRLTIAPDGDDAGGAAAQALAERAEALGWRVLILPAPQGRDWNDILNMKGDAA